MSISFSTAAIPIWQHRGMLRPSTSFLPSLLYVTGAIFLLVAVAYFHDALKFAGESGYRAAVGFATLFAAMIQFAAARIIVLVGKSADQSTEVATLVSLLLAGSRKDSTDQVIQLSAIADALRKANNDRAETNKALQWIIDNWEQPAAR
jgi:hypothetical protein